MPERRASESPVAQAISLTIAGLIQEGRVLSIKDLNEIAIRYGLSSGTYIESHLAHTFGTMLGSSANHQEYYYDIAGIETTKTRYKRHILLVSKTLPLDQTEWKEVTAQIDTKFHQAGVKSGQTWETSGNKVSRPRGGPWRRD